MLELALDAAQPVVEVPEFAVTARLAHVSGVDENVGVGQVSYLPMKAMSVTYMENGHLAHALHVEKGPILRTRLLRSRLIRADCHLTTV